MREVIVLATNFPERKQRGHVSVKNGDGVMFYKVWELNLIRKFAFKDFGLECANLYPELEMMIERL